MLSTYRLDSFSSEITLDKLLHVKCQALSQWFLLAFSGQFLHHCPRPTACDLFCCGPTTGRTYMKSTHSIQFPMISVASEWASERMNERSEAHKRNQQCGASEWVSDAEWMSKCWFHSLSTQSAASWMYMNLILYDIFTIDSSQKGDHKKDDFFSSCDDIFFFKWQYFYLKMTKSFSSANL